MHVAENNETLLQEQVKYASLNRRVMALTIDSVLLVFALIPFAFFIEPIFFDKEDAQVITDLSMQIVSTANINDFSDFIKIFLMLGDSLSQHSFFLKSFMKQTIYFIITGFIIVGLWWKTGTTPGKWITECKILNEDDLTEPLKAQYLKRYLAYAISLLSLCLGFLLLGIDKKKRAWHDRIAGTVVIIQKHNWHKMNDIFIRKRKY